MFEEEVLLKKKTTKINKKYDEKEMNVKVSAYLVRKFQQGQPLACTASNLGQCGRAEGYVLESKELAGVLSEEDQSLEKQISCHQ